jgi:hypothetical protein
VKKSKLGRVPLDLAEVNAAEAEQAALKPDIPQQRPRTHAHGARAPPDLRGFCDRKAAAVYLGIGLWFFDQLVREGKLPRGFSLSNRGKFFWSYRGLDEAMAKAARSRKPRRKAQGIVRERLEAEGDQ